MSQQLEDRFFNFARRVKDFLYAVGYECDQQGIYRTVDQSEWFSRSKLY
jgi:hypothetical protein